MHRLMHISKKNYTSADPEHHEQCTLSEGSGLAAVVATPGLSIGWLYTAKRTIALMKAGWHVPAEVPFPRVAVRPRGSCCWKSLLEAERSREWGQVGMMLIGGGNTLEVFK